MNRPKVFLTGGTGLVGSYILKRLYAEGYPITALRRPDSNMHLTGMMKNVDWVSGDFRDDDFLRASVNEAEIIVHCAGLVSFNPARREELMCANYLFTKHLTQIALEKNIQHFVLISSVSALNSEEISSGGHLNESAVFQYPSGGSIYGLSKFLGEREVWRANAEGLPMTIFNPGIVLGHGFWHKGSSKLIQAVARGNRFFTEGMGAYVDARDISELVARCLDSAPKNRRFILAAISLSNRHMQERIAKILGLKGPDIHAGKFVLFLAYFYYTGRYLLTKKEPLITKDLLRSSLRKFTFDGSEVCRQFDFTYMDIEDTLQHTIEGWQKDASILAE